MMERDSKAASGNIQEKLQQERKEIKKRLKQKIKNARK